MGVRPPRAGRPQSRRRGGALRFAISVSAAASSTLTEIAAPDPCRRRALTTDEIGNTHREPVSEGRSR